jgi:hypothetical protein
VDALVVVDVLDAAGFAARLGFAAVLATDLVIVAFFGDFDGVLAPAFFADFFTMGSCSGGNLRRSLYTIGPRQCNARSKLLDGHPQRLPP